MVDQSNPYKDNPTTDFEAIDNLSKTNGKEQIEKLRDAINYHDYKYYIENDPVISDAAYDQLFHRLEALEEKYPEFGDENSPTKRVGAEPVDALKKIEHQSAMLSLKSSLKNDEIKGFIERLKKDLYEENKEMDNDQTLEFFVEPKLDGLSVEIVYEGGEFKYGATRGDGYQGDDISENLKTIHSIPLKLRGEHTKIPNYIAVRGEILMLKDGFQKLNKKRTEENKETYANPRNAAAGIVRQLKPAKVADKPLDVYFYDILDIDNENMEKETPDSQKEVYTFLNNLGLKVNNNTVLTSGTSIDTFYKAIEDYREEMQDKRDRLNYEIDGIVMKLNDLKLREKLGTRERSPLWAMAWKFPSKKDVTTLKDIVIQVGRTGMLTPVALLEPVDIDGVTVSRATLHNAAEVRNKNLHPGDQVRIKRASDVIPEVIGRVENDEKSSQNQESKEFSMPKECPACGTQVIKEGAHYFCPNGMSCKAQLVNSIEHFASRDAADITHLGEEVAERLVDEKIIKNLADIYYVKKDDLIALEGFAEKSSENLIASIEESKELRLDKFIYGLGIRHVGSHLARVLVEKYDSLDDIIELEKDDLKAIGEIGEKIAESVYSFFREDKNINSINQMKKAGLALKPLKRDDHMPLKGQTFVFTGSLEKYTRSEAKDKVESLGAEATSDVSGNTDYLVVGEEPGSKLEKADDMSVEKISEEEWIKKIKRESEKNNQ
jgi:DNA ligase (NAD+)